jgi:flavin-dependent dehydrogenase
VAKRKDFDHFLYKQLSDLKQLSCFEEIESHSLDIQEDGAVLKTNQATFEAPIILGADGANSFVKRKLQGNKIDKEHYCAGLRQYYQGVEGIHPDSGIELHFYQEALPGYLWIFPLPNGQANVGVGMLSSAVSKKRIDLKEMMQDLLSNHPMLKERFKNAKPLEKVKGFGLPIGSRKVACSGNRYLLLGDAASLIDPFTGEGIGNAIRSGRIAADHLKEAFEQQRFDGHFNQAYDKEIYRRMWSELRLSRFLQKMLKFPRLFNFVVKKANKNEAFRLLITASVEDVDLRKQFKSPAFYFKLLFS